MHKRARTAFSITMNLLLPQESPSVYCAVIVIIRQLRWPNNVDLYACCSSITVSASLSAARSKQICQWVNIKDWKWEMFSICKYAPFTGIFLSQHCSNSYEKQVESPKSSAKNPEIWYIGIVCVFKTSGQNAAKVFVQMAFEMKHLDRFQLLLG